MKNPKSILILTVLLGIAFWFLDSFLHYVYLNPSHHSYLGMSTIYADPHQILVSSVFLLITIIVGLAISGMINDLRTTQDNLAESEKKFRALLENSNDIILIVDRDLKYKYVSPSVKRIYGYSPEEMIGKSRTDFVHPDDLTIIKAVLEDAQKTPDYSFLSPEYRVRGKDGEYHAMEAIIRNYLNIPGINGYVVNSRDISKRKETAFQLRQEKELAEGLALIGQEIIKTESTVSGIASIVLEFAQKLTGSAHGFASTIDLVTGDSIQHTYSEMLDKDCKMTESMPCRRFNKGSDGLYPTLRGHSLNVKKSIFTNSPTDHEEAKGLPNGHVPLKNFLSVPAMIGNNLVGQIALANSSHDYTQKDVEIVERIATLYALAVQRENYEQAIHEEKDLLKTNFNVAAVMLLGLDPDGYVTMINRRGCEILGYEENEILGKNWFDTFIPERNRQEMKLVADHVIAGNLQHHEYYENVIVTKNGVERIIAWRNANLRDKNGKVTSSLSSGEDITEKKQIEEITRIQRDLALELVSVKGVQKTFEVALDAAIQASGLDSGGYYLVDPETGNLRLIVHKGVGSEFVKQISEFSPDTSQHQLVMKAEPVYTNYTQMNKSENDILLTEALRAFAVIPLVYSDEVIACMNLASHSLDEVPMYTRAVLETIARQVSVAVMRAIAEEELVKHRDNLEELVKERTRELEETQEELVEKERLATLGHLVAVVSHEIRNPLGTIASSIYNLKQHITETDPIIIRSLERADRNVKRCDAIIEELLSFTSKRPQKMLRIDVDEWMSTVLEEIDVPEDIQLITNLNSGISIVVDTERCRRCLVNIITNAVQALLEEQTSAKKTIELATNVKFDRVEIMVKDNGPGIAEVDIARIFEPLYSTKSFGVGLGLTIVKQIIEDHGGDIEIESTQGEGTTVRIWLPLHFTQV